MTATDTEPTFDDGYLAKPAPTPDPPAAAVRAMVRHTCPPAVADDVYTAAATAEILTKGQYKADHLLFDQLVQVRAGTSWFQAAVDAAVAEERRATDRWRREAERLRRINLGALHVASQVDPHAGPGRVAVDVGNVRLLLGDSRTLAAGDAYCDGLDALIQQAPGQPEETQ